MKRPCEDSHVLMPERCRLCWLSLNDPRYVELWANEQQAVPATPLRPLCVELGGLVTPPEMERRKLSKEDRGCLGRFRECGVHGTCTVAVKREGVACCDGCPEHVARTF